MYWVLYHIVSGHAFFTGLVLVMISALASTQQSWIGHRMMGLALLIGLVLIAISAAPLPWWPYFFFAACILFWTFSFIIISWRRYARGSVILSCSVLIIMEAPFHFNPPLKPRGKPSVTVIGDSVTAGLGSSDESQKWTRLIADQHYLTVQDISHMGETVGSALKRVRKHEIESELVIIEIGGNDVLGSTTPEQFSTGLESLIEALKGPNRQLVMFELPLPPMYTVFGKHQRDIAAKHGVKLIPKRHFYSVIGKPQNTVDGVHLSQQGHDAMAAIVGEILR